MSSSRKRKERAESSHHTRAHGSIPSAPSDSGSHQALFIQAYEADVIRGPRAELAAIALEISDPDAVFSAHSRASSRRAGNGLIKWTGPGIHPAALPAFAEDIEQPEPIANPSKDDAIWVDRYVDFSCSRSRFRRSFSLGSLNYSVHFFFVNIQKLNLDFESQQHSSLSSSTSYCLTVFCSDTMLDFYWIIHFLYQLPMPLGTYPIHQEDGQIYHLTPKIPFSFPQKRPKTTTETREGVT